MLKTDKVRVGLYDDVSSLDPERLAAAVTAAPTMGRAPSFHDVMAPDDKIMFVQTLSKNWAMTGFRVGWLEAPAALGEVIENLIQFTTSGVPVFTQRAAIAALEEG